MQQFLESSEFIDWKTTQVREKARELAGTYSESTDIAKACFEFVRDEIKHSWDFKLNPVTCKASDVLAHGTGFCYAKSHLLAALLRANNIPAGLCYQRLTITDDKPEFCLHGLNAIHLGGFAWYKVDARGNKEGVNAQFSPPHEQLAFPIKTAGEYDFPEIWGRPLPLIVEALSAAEDVDYLMRNLPDIDPKSFYQSEVPV